MRVQERSCETCVYRKGSPLDPKMLEDRCRDQRGDFTSFRVCHSSHDACCAGFWARHKDHFMLGQVAQRMGWVQFVQDKIVTPISREVARAWKVKARRQSIAVDKPKGL